MEENLPKSKKTNFIRFEGIESNLVNYLESKLPESCPDLGFRGTATNSQSLVRIRYGRRRTGNPKSVIAVTLRLTSQRFGQKETRNSSRATTQSS